MDATYRLLVNGGESAIDIVLQEGDYSPLTDADMPALTWALGRAIRELRDGVAITISRSTQAVSDVPEV